MSLFRRTRPQPASTLEERQSKYAQLQAANEASRRDAAKGPLLLQNLVAQQQQADGLVLLTFDGALSWQQEAYQCSPSYLLEGAKLTYLADEPIDWSSAAWLYWGIDDPDGWRGEVTSAVIEDGIMRLEAEGFNKWKASWGIPVGRWLTPAPGAPVSVVIDP